MSKMQTHTLAASAGNNTSVTTAFNAGAGKIVDADTFNTPQVGGAIVLAKSGMSLTDAASTSKMAGIASA
jgi:hypothetical protein